MIITQEDLIKEIANSQNIDIIIVRQIFDSIEKNIFAYLSTTTPSENVHIKLLDGLSMESSYIPERVINKGLFNNYICNSKIKVKPNITRYYIDKLNEGL